MEIRVHLHVLFDKYLKETISSEELLELNQYVQSEEYADLWTEILASHYQKKKIDTSKDLLTKAKPIVDYSWHYLHLKIKQGKKPRIQNLYRYAAAAILILSLAGIWYYFNDQNRPHMQSTQIDDIIPGGNRATLTLSNGQKVALSESHSELVINSDGIAYGDGSKLVTSSDHIHTTLVSTPRGGQYQITLPDGTKIWLNAETTLRYAANSQRVARRVELEGEAYFDVQSMSAKPGTAQQIPFIVATRNQEIHVLGTEFNVMAYSDENNTKTTLVEGKIRIITDSGQGIDLNPGTQAVLDSEGLLSKHTVKTDNFTAWKEGIIVLHRQNMKQIFKEIERWYDVEFVIGEGVKLSSKTLSGNVFRDLPLSVLLQTLQDQTHHQFERKGRRIMVR